METRETDPIIAELRAIRQGVRLFSVECYLSHS